MLASPRQPIGSNAPTHPIMSGMPSQTIIIESDEGSSDLNDETGKSLEESSGDDLEREAADGFA